MDWEIREIEKYYLTKKDPKNLYENIKNMTPAELKEIVKKKKKNKKYSLKKITFQRKN